MATTHVHLPTNLSPDLFHGSIQGSVNTGQKLGELSGEVQARRNKLLDSAQEEEE